MNSSVCFNSWWRTREQAGGLCHDFFTDKILRPALCGFLVFIAKFLQQLILLEDFYMSNKQLCASSGYIEDPLALFYDLAEYKSNTILLESQEIHTKAGTRSFLGINSALRISCNGLEVTIKILNKNGEAVAKKLCESLPEEVTIVEHSASRIILRYPQIDKCQEEDSRLKAISVLDTLRSILKLEPISGTAEDLMLAGCFGYDLIATFEDLPKVTESTNTCPDYCFYLLDTIINIDHKSKTSCIMAVAFEDSLVPTLEEQVKLLKKKLDAY